MSTSVQFESVRSVFDAIPLALYNPVKIADTLQGSVWRASTSKYDTKSVVVKLTNRQQHNQSISIVNGTVFRDIKENILLEQSILKYLTQQTDCTPFITKFISFFETDEYYVLVQEDGGFSLFEFVRNAHRFIEAGKINIPHWKSVVKVIYKQLIEAIAYIHSKNVSHHDISLENILINDVSIDITAIGDFRFVLDDIQIKICDFGVADLYTNSRCISSKHCGKRHYKSPEVVNLKRKYNAKMNDIWCSGVCLFMMSFASSPWDVARDSDQSFRCIMDGHIFDILKHWKLLIYLDRYALSLFESIFQYEDDRINVAQIMKHPFLSSTFL